MRFCDIPIDTTQIGQAELNIETKTRSNLFAWNGQFSPQFVEAILKKYSTSNSFVVDPFLGSGTTLYECSRLGIAAYGTELNASAYYMSKVYEFSNLTPTEKLFILDKMEAIIREAIRDDNAINKILSSTQSENSQAVKDTLSLLVILLDLYQGEPDENEILKKWYKIKDIIWDLPFCKNKISAQHGDARNILLPDDTADLLLTSPPYINVFNYHQKYRRSVEALGFNVLNLAKSEFGSNRKNRGNRLLTVVQYCIDMALSISEASRVCKNDARLIYVVGRESSVLGYSFCNSELIYELATQIFGLEFDIRQERVFKNRFGQMIYEDILHFKNKKQISAVSHEEIRRKSILIAKRVLEEKIEPSTKPENIDFILSAIKSIDRIRASEVTL